MKNSEFYDQRHNFYLNLSRVGQGGLCLAVILGILTFIGGIFVVEETSRTWGSLLFNLMFFFSLSLGGIAFGNMQDVIGATWGRPIKRLHESFGAFIPWAVGLFFILLVCIKFGWLKANEMYRWVADPSILSHFHGKDVWLQYDFMMIRDVVALLIILGLSTWHLRITTKRDLSLVNGDKKEAQRLGEEAKQKLRHWSAPIMVVYSLTFSLICFDLTMSLAPTWFSTLWGGWSFAIMMQTLMALTLIMMFLLKGTTTGQYIKKKQFHDCGKLMFGFTVFFAYLTYAHILTYWYGNVPEETSYFLKRLEAPWIYFVMVSPFLSFLFPFFTLIPKASKWAAPITIPVSLVVLTSQWLNYMLVVIPEVTDGKTWTFPWIEIGLFFGMFGLFFFSIFKFGKKIPMIGIADPLLPAALHEDH